MISGRSFRRFFRRVVTKQPVIDAGVCFFRAASCQLPPAIEPSHGQLFGGRGGDDDDDDDDDDDQSAGQVT